MPTPSSMANWSVGGARGARLIRNLDKKKERLLLWLCLPLQKKGGGANPTCPPPRFRRLCSLNDYMHIYMEIPFPIQCISNQMFKKHVCWHHFEVSYIDFILLQIIVISSFLHYRPLTYKGSMGLYTYPTFANVIGWGVALSSMLMIPGYAIYYLLTRKGTLKQVHGFTFLCAIIFIVLSRALNFNNKF